MGKFSEALDKIAEGIKDMSSLEVVNYKGTIQIEADNVPADFSTILSLAKSQGSLTVNACTYVELDGDMKVFYDKEITQAEMDSHQELVDIARESRQAVVDLFKDAILSQI
jgi:hypothetical protein